MLIWRIEFRNRNEGSKSWKCFEACYRSDSKVREGMRKIFLFRSNANLIPKPIECIERF